MTAAIIFQNGGQLGITSGDVDDLVRADDVRITHVRTNESQSQWRVSWATGAFTVVANVHSEAHDILKWATRRG